MTNEQLINVACKWLDYNHSKYIVQCQAKLIVSGACQTDLRAFLNEVKDMNEYDAINLIPKDK